MQPYQTAVDSEGESRHSGGQPMDAFDYPLSPTSIAQAPAEPRAAARLLDATDSAGRVRHLLVESLDEILRPGDLVVVNDTRVVPARLVVRKATGGRVEVVLLEPLGPDRWQALVRPGRKVRPGSVLQLDGFDALEVGDKHGAHGERVVRLLEPDAVISRATLALPPYYHGPLEDPERYQTVYARAPG
ncbi:MAG: S-adenosylmethionine:tRNA ribosyltransferase-isomerase, partial [Thermoplasmata archaeon]